MKLAIKTQNVHNPAYSVALTHGMVFTLEEFNALVKYERTRSDRNGTVFSIIEFTAAIHSKIDNEILINSIAGFARSIDCIGDCEHCNTAVLLPDTIKSGAEIFGKKVLDELSRQGRPEFVFDIYSYPEDWLYTKPILQSQTDEDYPVKSTVKDRIETLFVAKIPGWKRSLDIVLSSLILIAALPVELCVALFIKVVSPGPVFFNQIRIGYRGTPFHFWKFRTMKTGNNQVFHEDHSQSFIKSGDVPMEKLDNHDPRIILGGKVIRKCCLDELPQLWNVLKGDMSLVGPRPCIPYEAKEYLRWHTHRFDVLPGLSGLWQVSGKNKLTFKQMVRLDIHYCEHMTLWGDLAIIARTPFAILKMVAEAFKNKYAQKPQGSLDYSMAGSSRKSLL